MLPGQVFALEVLERPLQLTRRGGMTELLIDRRDCREGIYTTQGKAQLVERTMGSQSEIGSAQEADKAVHRFLIGGDGDAAMEIEHAGIRWASGGVLSVVDWRGATWTPFFFRDIPPFGWNISLGGSDRGDDLGRPEGFIEREFLEETLVVNGAPTRGRPVGMRHFLFGRGAVGDERRRAAEHASVHLAQRLRRDGLTISPDGDDIPVAAAPTRMRATIVSDTGRHTMSDVLVCMNRLEAAVEVVKAVHFSMSDDDVILDGELLEPAGSVDPPDLIRMPVAMISHAYLRRAFGPAWRDFEHAGTLQPSVEGPRVEPHEIVIFDHDVVRRRDIWRGDDPAVTDFEKTRYDDWTERFGMHFYDADGCPSVVNPSSMFTLPAAKVLSYYFAHA